MKRGIKALLIVFSVALAWTSHGALATTTANQARAEQSGAQAPSSARMKSGEVAQGMAGQDEKVNINSATAEELARVMSGIGLKKAQAIVSFREEFGPFKTLDDLTQVPGMGHALVERNINHLTL